MSREGAKPRRGVPGLRVRDFAEDGLNVVDGILDHIPHLVGHIRDLPLHLLPGHRCIKQSYCRAGECSEEERVCETLETAGFVEHADVVARVRPEWVLWAMSLAEEEGRFQAIHGRSAGVSPAGSAASRR